MSLYAPCAFIQPNTLNVVKILQNILNSCSLLFHYKYVTIYRNIVPMLYTTILIYTIYTWIWRYMTSRRYWRLTYCVAAVKSAQTGSVASIQIKLKLRQRHDTSCPHRSYDCRAAVDNALLLALVNGQPAWTWTTASRFVLIQCAYRRLWERYFLQTQSDHRRSIRSIRRSVAKRRQ